MKIRNRTITKFASFCAVILFRLLFLTCRKKFIGKVPEARLETVRGQIDREHFVLCVWHDALLLPTFSAPRPLRQQCCCLVSQHTDGSYLADAMALMDYTAVRGSSKRGGAEAIREIVDGTAGKHIIITPDGPRGPRRQLKVGPLYIAAQTGRRLLPGAMVVKNGWRIRGNWTDLLIPMPFTTIYLITGEPIAVPANLERHELHNYMTIAQDAMDRLNEEADKMYSRQPGNEFIPRRKAA